jgi:hypothetical protein
MCDVEMEQSQEHVFALSFGRPHHTIANNAQYVHNTHQVLASLQNTVFQNLTVAVHMNLREKLGLE